MSTTTSLTITPGTWDTLADDPRYLGWGYLNGRTNLTPAARESADATVQRAAEQEAWTIEDLFLWANSKLGRWFADLAADRLSDRELWDRADAWNLFDIVGMIAEAEA